MSRPTEPPTSDPTQTRTDAGSAEPADTINDLGELLAHALEMEHESVAQYAQLADSMEVHHNVDVARLFRRLAELSEEHATAIAARAQGVELPRIAPWAFKWHCPGTPEGGDCLHGEVSYQMTAVQALEVALHNESRGQAFYDHVARGSGNAAVRRLAAEMASEEAEHLALLEDMLARERQHVAAPPRDLDPPHTPA